MDFDRILFKKYLGGIVKHYEDSGINIRPFPTVSIIRNIQNASNPLGRTGYYDWQNKHIVLYITDRHIKDILRTFCHELIHHNQCCENGELKVDTQNVNNSQYLSGLEGEAYLKGNMLFRSWEDNLKQSE